MMKECRCCGQPFPLRPQNPNQNYCKKPACQMERKREWQRRKRADDPDYRANDRSAQRRWAEAHPGYWRTWREGHPKYVERNRTAQRERNAMRRADPGHASGVAKGDAWMSKNPLPAGSYRIEPWVCEGDCKCGRVNGQRLFIISSIATE